MCIFIILVSYPNINFTTIPSAEGEDYTVTPPGVYEAAFPSVTTMNGDTACDTITIIDDSDLEGQHDFRFTIDRATVGGTFLPGIQFMDQFTTVAIEDNEGIIINVHCLRA